MVRDLITLPSAVRFERDTRCMHAEDPTIKFNFKHRRRPQWPLDSSHCETPPRTQLLQLAQFKQTARRGWLHRRKNGHHGSSRPMPGGYLRTRGPLLHSGHPAVTVHGGPLGRSHQTDRMGHQSTHNVPDGTKAAIRFVKTQRRVRPPRKLTNSFTCVLRCSYYCNG